jgi:hypothetical protein
VPGDYIITAFKKDQRINNVTYTPLPSAAAPLPLPFLSSHSTMQAHLCRNAIASVFLPVFSALQYTRGRVPGDYIIITAFKKDQRINNVPYTSLPSAAAPLSLPVDPVLHQPLLSSQQETVVGTVRRREGLAVTLWNQRRGSCNRQHVLLLSPLPATAGSTSGSTAGSTTGSAAGSTNGGTAGSTNGSTAPVVSWAPGELDLASVAPHTSAATSPTAAAAAAGANPAAAAAAAESAISHTQAAPGSAAAASTLSDWGVRPNTTLLDPLPAADAIATTWPPPGGQLIECAVEMRGNSAANGGLPSTVDVGFAAGLFRVEPSYDSPGEAVVAICRASVFVVAMKLHMQ